MIPVLLFLATTTALGLLWTKKLTVLRGRTERLGVAMAAGMAIQLWLPFFTSKCLGYGIKDGPAFAFTLSFLGLIASAYRLRHQVFLVRRIKTVANSLRDERETRYTAIFFALVGGFIGLLFYTHSLMPAPEGLTSSGVSWEDQAGHAMYASSFLYSDNLEALDTPFFADQPLAYPFLCNLLAAVCVRLGASMSDAFWLTGWYAAMTFLVLAWCIARDWTGTSQRAHLVLFLVLCTGGLGFVDFIQGILSGTPWMEMLIKHDYANAWELKLHYHNILTAILLPMRSLIFGLPLALSAVLLIYRSLERGILFARTDLIAAGLFTGLMPLVNAHVAIMTGWCGAFLALIWLRFDWKGWLRLFLSYVPPMVLLAAPQLFWIHQQTTGTNQFFRIHLGWMAEAQNLGEWAWYWLHNGGIRLPLGIVCWFLAPVRLKKLSFPFLSLLILGNVVAFQPLVYDNVKLFLFPDFALICLIVIACGDIVTRSKKTAPAVVLVLSLMSASGILSIWREMKIRWAIVDWDGVNFAEVVKQNSPARARFLTSSKLTHPVPVLTGRAQVLGYDGWAVNLGIPLGTIKEEVLEMFSGGPNAEPLLEKHRVKFVVVGPLERSEFPNLNENFISGHSSRHWDSGAYKLYELAEPSGK